MSATWTHAVHPWIADWLEASGPLLVPPPADTCSICGKPSDDLIGSWVGGNWVDVCAKCRGEGDA